MNLCVRGLLLYDLCVYIDGHVCLQFTQKKKKKENKHNIILCIAFVLYVFVCERSDLSIGLV